ncbi:hypothetical protein Leryth_021009 [Lithospermum erythrorhizon]|nr:hypothetical protein Leryth_021009 [Lithospermum erythrorhizon]
MFNIYRLISIIVSAGFKGLSGGRQENYETGYYSRRIAVETATANSTYMILAASRTYRRDPFDSFRYYRGGWNVTNMNYFSSLAYSSMGPMFMGVTWFLLFGIFLLCMCCCCSRGKKYGYSRCCFFTLLILLTFFSLAVVCGSGIIYKAQQKFEDSIVDTSSYLLKEGGELVVHLSDMGKTLAAAKDLGASPELKIPEEQTAQIDQVAAQMTNVTQLVHTITNRSSNDIRTSLIPVKFLLICLTTVLLGMAVFGFVFCICGLECLLNILVMFGWILVLGTFFASSFYLLVSNATADTCVSIDEWLQIPTANTALESIIPKVDTATAQEMINVSKNVTFSSISVINSFIVNVSNVDVPPQAGPPLYYNQSGPQVPILCNLYNNDFTDRQCAIGEITLEKAPEVWKGFVCQVSDTGICTTPGRLTPTTYNQFTSSLNVTSGLNAELPFMTELMNTTYLKNVLGKLSKDYCPNLVKYSSWMYTGFIWSTIAVMFSIIIWLMYGSQRKNRSYTKKVDSGRDNIYGHQYL